MMRRRVLSFPTSRSYRRRLLLLRSPLPSKITDIPWDMRWHVQPFWPFHTTLQAVAPTATICRWSSSSSSSKPSTIGIQDDKTSPEKGRINLINPNVKEENNDDDMSSVRISIDIAQNNPNGASDWKIPGAEKGGRKLAALFTCKVCNTRSMKQFTEHAYTHGVVIVKCPGCQNQHLLADRLGYFDDQHFDLERIARENGESLTTVTSGDTELDLELLLGKEKWTELLNKVNGNK